MKKLIAGFLGVVGFTVAAYAAMWTGLPIINGLSYCSTLVNNSCTNTVPAGPALTGSELIPADTQLSQGRNPATAYLSQQALGTGPYVYNAPLTAASITLTNLTRQLIVEPAGTIAALTVVFPAASTLVDNQRLGICTTQIVTALTLTAGIGTTISNGPTALQVPVATGAASCPEWIYRQLTASTGTWYRTQ